ncbi:MAG: hypothetical protein ACKPKO_20205 [Candidatus Fonsibacter sp.]
MLTLPEQGRVMEFTNFKNQLQRPYIVYADTESTLVKSKEPGILHKHVANSACFFILYVVMIVVGIDYGAMLEKIV